jgi:D-alanyl-D-alanine dipeptidase
MDVADLSKIRRDLALADLRRAKRHSILLIGQTTRGTVEVTHADGVYALTTQGDHARLLAKGARGVVAAALAPLYQIVIA